MEGLVVGACVAATMFFAYHWGRMDEQRRLMDWLQEDMRTKRITLDYVDLMLERLDG